MPQPPRRTPSRTQGRPQSRTAAQAPPKPRNPAAEERTALRQALAVQANRLEEQDKALRSLAFYVKRLRDDRKSIMTVINRQASIIEGFGVRHETAERQIAHVAAVTGSDEAIVKIGREGYLRVASVYRKANPSNPAQPIMEPLPEGPVATSQEEMLLGAQDDVTQLGASPLTDVSPDAVIPVDQPYGMTAVTPEGLVRQDVTAPVAGTDQPNPPQDVITPVDVRFGDPDNPESAFPWQMGPVGAPQQHIQGPAVGEGYSPVQPPNSMESLPAVASRTAAARPQAAPAGAKRPYATMRLAKLQIAAGLASGDEITVAAALDSSGMPDQAIAHEIDTLTRVASAQGRTPEGGVSKTASDETRHLVPKRGSSTTRAVPSMAGEINREAAAGPSRITPRGSNGLVTADELGFA